MAIAYISFALIAAIGSFPCASPEDLLATQRASRYVVFLFIAEPSNALGSPALNDTDLPDDPISSEGSAPAMAIPQWDGGDRINIAFFGLRDGHIAGEDCPVRTDTIILLTVDPVTKTAGMLSIPRDIWVNNPGCGYSRSPDHWRGCQIAGRRTRSGDGNRLSIHWSSHPLLCLGGFWDVRFVH